MPKFLTSDEIRHAVEQLGRSSAKPRMCEFLIGVRTLRLADSAEVQVAESIPEFAQAVEELARWAPDASVGEPVPDFPYFNPFGRQAAYKFQRYPSNGPSNTMHGWATQSDSPFAINADTRPKSIGRRDVTVAQLRRFLLNRNAVAERPRLIDAAIWYFRRTDLEDSNASGPDRTTLEERFVADLGLTDDEVTALFRREADDTDADAMPTTPTAPDEDATEEMSGPADDSGENEISA